jgi:Icc-related predicted phosphoesterase
MINHVRFAYSSDIHGNLEQYKKLVTFTNDKEAQFLFIGGDLFPKAKDEHDKQVKTIDAQRQFFEYEILPILHTCKAKVYITFGNADFYANIDYYRQLCNNNNSNVTIVNAEVISLPDCGLYLFGYAGVPFSRHRMKDFERYDTRIPSDTLELRNPEYVVLDGHVSFTEEQFHKELLNNCDVNVKFKDLKNEELRDSGKYGDNIHTIRFPRTREFIQEFSIESQMRHILERLESLSDEDESVIVDYRKHIWMIHGPPMNTCLDYAKNGEHVGSIAVRQLIQEKKPLLTLHGHIHETVDKSEGKYHETIGEGTECFGTGNYPHYSKVAVIISDIDLCSDNVICSDRYKI